MDVKTVTHKWIATLARDSMGRRRIPTRHYEMFDWSTIRCNFMSGSTFAPWTRIGDRNLIGSHTRFHGGTEFGNDNTFANESTFGEDTKFGLRNEFGVYNTFESRAVFAGDSRFAGGQVFGTSVVFNDNIRFGNAVKFMGLTTFGSKMTFGGAMDWNGIVTDHIYTLANIDGTGRHIYIARDNTRKSLIRVQAGCYVGTDKEFITRAKNQHKHAYAHLVKAFCRGLKKL